MGLLNFNSTILFSVAMCQCERILSLIGIGQLMGWTVLGVAGNGDLIFCRKNILDMGETFASNCSAISDIY